MFSHEELWQAIDRLAQMKGLSASGLAKKANLDATTFNPSKRIGLNAKKRWPSTESLSKILQATDMSMEDFVALLDGNFNLKGDAKPQRMMLGSLSSLELDSMFDAAGFPVGEQWDSYRFEGLGDALGYFVEVSNYDYEPVFRDGAMLFIAPQEKIQRRDRMLMAMSDGTMIVAIMSRRTSMKISYLDITQNLAETSVDAESVRWLAKISWASQ